MCSSFCSKISTVFITSRSCLAHDGQEIIFTPYVSIQAILGFHIRLLLPELDLQTKIHEPYLLSPSTISFQVNRRFNCSTS